ncbi:hypothetical protein VOLCADRAFT_100625 [Volvox carteri f. nagariensis]|uniref:Uncharacterized protein n=1 Tax=Volvox carteri f. nagariensis TaxID=3068 RepID=D8UKN8_VOLCA|nr:uncharacterized protein VOLCADRAFT_100625 [Volvox carteri f. nagariensis]EFJ39712.1 hypothetical protein VOLCADRAFT_100625 [Volvox carteri f. nagariensis]|eukprot:XP_002959219.1 hypothetical protein VOLCADRAFT_100625 [Volvox carteri f. nagariensis]
MNKTASQNAVQPTRTTLDKHCTVQCASNCVVRCTLNCALNCMFNCMSSCVVGCVLKCASRRMSNCAVRCSQCFAICVLNRGAVRCSVVRCGVVRCDALPHAVWRGAVQRGAVRCGADTEAVHGDARGRIARAQAWSSAVRDDAAHACITFSATLPNEQYMVAHVHLFFYKCQVWMLA